MELEKDLLEALNRCVEGLKATKYFPDEVELVDPLQALYLGGRKGVYLENWIDFDIIFFSFYKISLCPILYSKSIPV
mgnify:CR=1 FL=1